MCSRCSSYSVSTTGWIIILVCQIVDINLCIWTFTTPRILLLQTGKLYRWLSSLLCVCLFIFPGLFMAVYYLCCQREIPFSSRLKTAPESTNKLIGSGWLVFMAILVSPHYGITCKLGFLCLSAEALLKNLHKFALNDIQLLPANILRINYSNLLFMNKNWTA